ncbi:MAG: SIS domain-containing protein [Planctomycetes bacterium]|nr:SIS domain-containing protein [Planctomycetota bacterium]
MFTVREAVAGIVSEVSDCLGRVSPESLQSALAELGRARRIFLLGAGRSGLGIRGFAIRLAHLGRPAYLVGETTTPPIEPDDLLVIGSGSGRTVSLLAMAARAKKTGARILLFTADVHSPIGQLADCRVEIPAPTPKAVGGQPAARPSVQPMGSLFEQCLFLLLDLLVMLMMQEKGIQAQEMFARHANLE